jgi:predicted phosphodiesterase
MMARRFAILMLVATAAAARQPDGALGLIITPNSGLPVILTPGDVFEADLAGEAKLTLVGDAGTLPLEAEWTELPGARVQAQCTVPDSIPPGTYALEALAGQKRDRNVRAVFVRESMPTDYAICHITDVHIGKEKQPREPDDAFRELLAAVNKTGAAFVLVTGDITETGTPEQFQRFVEILNTCTLPTFVCTGNHDRADLNYERTFGPVTYMFRFGPDGYLVFDTKDFVVADELGSQDSALQRFRRAIKPARWSIGVTHRYWADMGMRSQLTLFVDDPLDALIFGHWHRENREGEKRVPWGTTPVIVTPAAYQGALRMIMVTKRKIAPGPVEFADDKK